MAEYTKFISRNTNPDFTSLVKQIRVVDPTAGPIHTDGSEEYIIKTNTALDDKQIEAMQLAIDTAPISSPKLQANSEIDSQSIADRALFSYLLDEINILRTRALLPVITLEEAIAAAKVKTTVGVGDAK